MKKQRLTQLSGFPTHLCRSYRIYAWRSSCAAQFRCTNIRRISLCNGKLRRKLDYLELLNFHPDIESIYHSQNLKNPIMILLYYQFSHTDTDAYNSKSKPYARMSITCMSILIWNLDACKMRTKYAKRHSLISRCLEMKRVKFCLCHLMCLDDGEAKGPQGYRVITTIFLSTLMSRILGYQIRARLCFEFWTSGDPNL